MSTDERFCPDEDDGDYEMKFWLCPYLPRYEGWPGHDPHATCTFGCYDEPACVTGGPWTEEQYAEAVTWLSVGPEP